MFDKPTLLFLYICNNYWKKYFSIILLYNNLIKYYYLESIELWILNRIIKRRKE